MHPNRSWTRPYSRSRSRSRTPSMSYSSCLMYSRSMGRGLSRSRFMSRGRKNHRKDDIRDSRSKSRSPRSWLPVHLQFVHLIYFPRVTCFMVPTGLAPRIRHPFRQNYILDLETHEMLQSTFVSSRFGNTCHESASVRTNR